VRARLFALAVLAALPAIGTPAAGQVPPAEECGRFVGAVDLQMATIPELQAEMAAGSVTSAQLVDAYLARIGAYDVSGPKLNAIRELREEARSEAEVLDQERAAGQLRGPLHGIPVLLKDNIGTADTPTTAGSIALEGVIPEHDAVVTQRLRDAGAVILGKANLSEFAGWVDLDMPPGYSSLAGQVVNAYDFDLSPGGSSAGSGVATSMAFAAAAIGTETSGSILNPSQAGSLVGVKTTHGLIPTDGILPLAPSFDVPGPMARSVTDAATMLGALTGGDYTTRLSPTALEGITLAYDTDARGSLGDEELALFDEAIARLERLGATVVGVENSLSQFAGLPELAAIPNEFKASLNRYLAEEMPTASVKTLGEIVEYNRQHPDRMKYGQDLLEASNLSPGLEALFPAQAEPTRALAREEIDRVLADADADAIITPGLAHANAGAAAGYPTVIEPLGYLADGTEPVGLSFLGPRNTEADLPAYAYAYEQDARVRVPPTDVNPELDPGACAAP
jgi:Asp-tRNA(Asn)/Glu-tRNA(Gln) amidotransferase A subunit family amidase